MKTNNIDIGYRGQIEIKYVKNGTVIKKIVKHNQGTAVLFNFIANCLAGNSVDYLRPKFIRLFNAHDAGDFNATTLVTPSQISLLQDSINVTSNNDSYTTSFDFLVSEYNLNSDEYQAIALYAENNYNNLGNPSAYVILDEVAEVPEKTNVLVTWKMTITNI